ncbi:penicillin-binding protein activator [Marinicella gelatinilytica]|uniref:penicillin-binding protein activator n=1 Tax=Marinicella gelatinilytica TaxID=2996017 RepID=UPI002260E9CC|nr:penicillin-binding protein activator [Marinicella gelatinilytica]MCX7544066.1 penicillin-binding protein activator [Marinicella gelatinilytica]
MKFHYSKTLFILLVVLLSACASGPSRHTGDEQQRIDKALSIYQEGHYFEAAELLRSLWQENPDNLAVYEALLDTYYQLGELPVIWSLRQQTKLSSDKINIVMAEVAHISDNCQKNLTALTEADIDSLNSVWLQRLYRIRSTCFHAAGDDLAALIDRIRLVDTLPTEQQWLLYDDIVSDLASMKESALIMRIGDFSEEPLIEGWLEAAYVNFGADGDSTDQFLRDWPTHPATRYFYGYQGQQQLQKIAVLLPLSGRFAGAGLAVQRGMLTAAADDFEQRHELLFFDTGSAGENIAGAWFSAQAANVDMVIGPLDKPSIEQLAQFSPPTVPVMLLNQSEQDFFQFTLSPESEAAQVAERMFQDGLRRVLIFAPSGDWGQRMSQAFANAFVALGGQIINNQYFNQAERDYSAVLRQQLGLVESQLRAKNLQSYLKLNLQSEAVVSHTIDGIFMPSNPDFARMMVPQLLFNHAGHIPVYATSHIYSGREDQALNKDLSGVVFSISPIQLPPEQLRETLNFDLRMITDNRDLFALGYDALLLVDRLQWMSRVAGGRLQGLSGLLSMGVDKTIQRGLQWAIFDNGGVIAID